MQVADGAVRGGGVDGMPRGYLGSPRAGIHEAELVQLRHVQIVAELWQNQLQDSTRGSFNPVSKLRVIPSLDWH